MSPFPLGSLAGSTRKSAMLRALSPVILIAGLAVVCTLLVMVPAESWPGPGCLVRKHSGIHCPGCGGTRAAGHLVQGSWREAFRDNLLIYPVAAGILWGIVQVVAGFRLVSSSDKEAGGFRAHRQWQPPSRRSPRPGRQIPWFHWWSP